MTHGETSARGNGALSDLRVLDLADQKGQYCTKLLADLGADVIKVEPPGGDAARNIGPFFHDDLDPEKSLYFFHFNTSKRSVTLDLNSLEGQKSFKKLVQTADVLVETFQPGYLDGLGLGYETLEGLNPGLVMTSITGFGRTGPWSSYKSSDLVGMATGGMLYLCGWPEFPPQRMAASQAYYMASVQAAAGTLLAILHRRRAGKGQHVDVSMQQSIPVCLQNATQTFEKTGKVRVRTGNERLQPEQPGQGIFRCKDGYVDIGQLSGVALWERFVNWLESEGAVGDLKEAKWEDPFYRASPEAIESGNRVLKEFLARHTAADIFNRGQKSGVVIGPVNTPADIVNDPHFEHRDFFVPVEHPELGATLRYLGAPYKLSGTPWKIARRAPMIGEHNAEVYGEGFGFPAREGVTERCPQGKAPAMRAGCLPLEGVRVIEFTEQIAGPMVGKALADYGAEVILIENEARVRSGTSTRHPGTGSSSLTSLNLGHNFNKFNTNKLSLTLDLKKPAGMQVARRLIGKSDVIISNFVPGVLDRWGLNYPELQKIKPDIIFLTMPAFGSEGPYRDYRTFSWNLMAMCGWDYASGFPGGRPLRASPFSHPDTSCQPFHALVATLASLHWRARTGKGQHIELCQYESTLCFTETLVFDYLVNRRLPQAAGNRLDYAAPHGVYRCKGDDEWCAIAVFTDEEWRSLCKVIDKLDLIGDTRFACLRDRRVHADELDGVINQWAGRRSKWDVMDVLQKAGIAAGAVETVEDLLVSDPQLKARNHWVKIDHPEAGKLTNEDWGFRLSAVPALKWRHAPLLGEHNDLILNGVLGMSESEIDKLIIDGIVS